MRRSFEVRWAATAERDLLGVIEYIVFDDPGTAMEVLKRIRVGTARLDFSPRRGRIVPELLKQGVSRYRELVIKPWRVIYRVEESRVFVVAVIDGRRNVEDVLLERLLR